MNKEIFNKMNEYLINKKEIICIDETIDDVLSEKVNPTIVLGMAANLDTWGYRLNDDCINKLFKMSEGTVVDIYNNLIKTIKEIKGDDVNHDTLLFKNFPDSCRQMDINELSINRFDSYIISLIDMIFETNYYNEIKWDGEVLDRTTAKHEHFRTIKLGTEKDFCDMVNNMLSGRMSLSKYDKEIIDFAITNFDIKNIIPDEIPFKENWAYIAKKVINENLDYNIKIKTFTDFVRLTVALSDGDISLSTKPILKTFKSNERKKLIKMLDDCIKDNKKSFEESILNKKNRRFFEMILLKGWHIESSYKNYCKNIMKAYNDTKNKYSLLSQAEQAMEKGDYLIAASKFNEAGPGYLIRHANSLISKAKEKDKYIIAGLISEKADKVATPVLLNMKNALYIDNPYKVAFIKGNTAKNYMFENTIKIDNTTKTLLSNIVDNAINEQFKNKESLGKIYIDKNLKDCPVPFDGRTDNGKNRSVERGTKLPAKEDKQIIRAFCYKKHSTNGFYDLSTSFLDENFNLVESCSWRQLKSDNSGKPIAVHSGDNPNCRKGCTEFIDIDIEALRNYTSDKHIKYVAFQVFAWNHIPFNKMERCFFGIMQRDSLLNDKITENDKKILKENGININLLNNNHEPYYFNLSPEQMKLVKDYKQEVVFDPATVDYRYDLTGNSLTKVPMLYDVDENKFIFVDLDAEKENPFIKVKDKREEGSHVPDEIINKPLTGKTIMLEDFIGATAKACYSVVNLQKPNLYDLFTQISKATEAEIVDNIEDADVICTIDRIDTDKKVITPFDRDEIVSYFLTPSKQTEKEIEIEKIEER